MNLLLCGMMGAGKTTVGRRLAEKTGKQFVDTDALIAERYGAICDIFQKDGEARFREMETEVLHNISNYSKMIVSTGGGIVLKQENRTLLKRIGKVCYLRASVSSLAARVKHDDTRPLLKDECVEDKLRKLMAERELLYCETADLIIDTDALSVEEVVDAICSVWEEI